MSEFVINCYYFAINYYYDNFTFVEKFVHFVVVNLHMLYNF